MGVVAAVAVPVTLPTPSAGVRLCTREREATCGVTVRMMETDCVRV